MPNILRAKCVVVGNAKVGKTSIVQQFLADGSQYSKQYQMTMGVDLKVKVVHIPDTDDKVELFIYDSSGKAFYRNMLANYWGTPNLFLGVFDVSNEKSLEALKSWTKYVRETNNDIPVPGAIVANKTDLRERRVVTPKAGRQFATKMGLPYFETSAVSANHEELKEGIEDPFFYLANEWHKKFIEKTASFSMIS